MIPISIKSKLLRQGISLATLLFFLPTYAFGLPTDMEVVSGTATFEQVNDTTLNITASADSIINYGSFDIAANETVNFFLPDLDAFSLNRITDGGTTNIFGTLTANGNLILVNTHGFNFGATAQVNVGGIIASAHDIANTDFLAGHYTFKGADAIEASSAAILNSGSILTREGGMAILIADAIENRGTIEAPVGTVALAAGKMVSVGLSQDGLISIVVDEATANQVLDKDGNPITEQIKNTGTLSTASGKVSITAKAVDQIFDSLLDSQGIIRADTAIVGKDGVIEIVSSHDIQSTGEISANQGEIILDAGGAVISKGLLETQRLIENGASFLVGGVYKVGLASVQNLDNAVTLDTGNYSGLTSDVANIIVNDNAVITLTGSTTFDADSDDNGTGTFTMNAGSSIAGAGFDLTINTSGNSTLRSIDNVGILTLGRSANSTPTYTANEGMTNLTGLSVDAGVNLDLNGQPLSFDSPTAVSNEGTITLIGDENFTNISNLDTDSGTVVYRGDSDSEAETFTVKDFGEDDYYNLKINSRDLNDTFDAGNSVIHMTGNATLANGKLDLGSQNFVIDGSWIRDGGTLNAASHILTTTGWKLLSDIQAGDQVMAHDSNGLVVINTVEKKEYVSAEQYETFTTYLINGQYELYENQSIWANGRVVHAFELNQGDTLLNENGDVITITSLEALNDGAGWNTFTISGNHSYIVNGLELHNASRYWVGGGSSANWNATGNTNWGGASNTQDNASVPVSSDDVFFDGVGTGASNSTLSADITIRSLDMTGYTNTLTHNASVTLNIGDATAGANNNALIFGGLTYTLGSSTSSAISFISTSATQQNVNFNGKTAGNVTFNGAGGSWKLTGTLNANGSSSTTVNLTKGALDTNGQTISTGIFNSSNSNTRSLTLGSSSITGNGLLYGWNLGTATNLTFDAGTSTITLNGLFSSLNGGGLTYNNVVLSGQSAVSILGANTFANLTRTGGGNVGDKLALYANQTITGTLTLNGNNATSNRLLIYSDTAGTARTLTAATLSASNVDFQDITGAGAANWDLSAISGLSGDAGGNSGITLTPAATQYWKTTTSGSKNWSTAANWFLATNGGGGAGRVPLPQDNVVFDANSIGAAGTTITSDPMRIGKNIDWSSVTNNPTWTFGGSSNSMFGSLTLASGMTITNSSNILTFEGRGSSTLTSAGVTFQSGVSVSMPGGSLSLQDDFLNNNSNNYLTVNNGTFDANGHNVTIPRFNSNNQNTRTLTLGSGTWTLTGSGTTIWDTSQITGLTINRGNPIVSNYSGSSFTRIINAGNASEANTPSFAITAGSDTVTITTNVYDLDFTGFSGTLANSARTVYGNFTASSGMTIASGTSTTTFGATSGTKTITSNGKTFDFPITFNGVGGTWQLGDDLTVGSTRTTTLTNGTFNANGKNFSMGSFSSNNSNTRTITMGAGTWTLTGNAGAIWDTGTTTNLTLNRGNAIVANYAGSAGTRTISGAPTEATSADFNVTAGTDTVGVNSGVRDLNFTGFSGTLSNAGRTVYGDLTISSGMTLSSGTSATTFAATSGTKTITSNGKTLDFALTFNGIGGTWQLADAMTVGGTRAINVTNGTLSLNGKNLSGGTSLSVASGGTLKLQGAETFGVTPTLNAGSTVIYTGDGDSAADTYTMSQFTASSFKNLTIASTDAADIFQENGATTVATNLTISSGIYSLNGNDITVSGTFSNNGTVRLRGNESTISLTQDTDSGIWQYVGDGDSAADTFTVKDFGATDYYNLVFNSTDGTTDVYQLGGALSIGSGGSITNTAGVFSLNGNNLSFASSTAVSNNGTFRLRGSETLTNVSNLDIDSGTVEYVGDGDSAADTFTIKDFGATDYYNLTINSTDGTTDIYQLGANIDIDGAFNLSAGAYDQSTRTMNVTGNFSLASGTTFTKSSNSSALTFDGTGSLTDSNGTKQDLGAVVIGGSSTTRTLGSAAKMSSLTINSGDTLSLAGNNFTFNSSAAVSNNGTFRLQGGETLTNVSNLDIDSGTVEYVGNGDGNSDFFTLKDFGATDYYNLLLNMTDGITDYVLGTKTIVNNFTVAGGYFVPNGTTTVGGLTTISGGRIGGTSSATNNFNGGLTISSGNYEGYNTFVTSITGDLQLDGGVFQSGDGGAATISGNFLWTNGNYNNQNGTTYVGGNFTKSGGSFLGTNKGTLDFNGSGTQTFDSGATSFYNLTHSGSGTLRLNTNALTVTNNFTNSGGTFDLNGLSWTMTGATFSNTANVKLRGSETITGLTQDIDSGTFTYVGDGDSAADTFTIKDFGSVDYYNLDINSTDGATDTYQLGANINIDGNFTNTSGTFDVSASNYSMNVAGNWSNSGTFTARAGTVTMDAGATGKTVTTSGQAFNALVFNGSGGGWTLQDALTAASIQLTAGTLIDNAKTVTVNGNITIANTAGLLTSTGTWIQGASGNISSRANIINELQIANSVTSTRTDRVQTKKLVLGTNATLTGSGEVWVNAAANDFVDMASGASITTGNLAIYPSVGGTLTQKALSTSGANIEVGYRASSTIQMTGNWTTNRDLWVHGTTTSTSEATALVLDTNGYNLNIRGLFMGTQNAGFPNAYQGKVLFRNGTHTLSDGIVLYPGTGGSYGYLDFGSSSISVGGNIDFSSMTVTPGTSTVTLNAAATGKTLKSNGQSFYGLILNGSGGGWTLQDALTASSIQLTAGNLIDNAKTVTINGDISIGNTSGLLTSTGTWIQGASGNISNPYTSNSTNLFNELQIAGGITSTRTGLVKTKKLVMGNNATLTGAQRLWVQPGSNDFIDLGTGATITSGPLSIIPIVTGTTLTQKAFSIGSTIEVGYQSSVTVQMTGNWTTTSDIWVNGHTSSTSEATALVLDTNGYNLSARGLYLGTGSVSFPNAYYSKIYFRTGTHTFTDIASIHSSVSSHGTHTYLDLGSSNISFGAGVNSNINFASTTITPGTSTVTLNSAGSGKTFNSNGQSFYNFTISGGGSWTLQDGMDVNGSFSLTSGTFDQSTSTMNVAGNFSLSSGSTFTKSSNSSALTFDGTGSLTDSNGTKQDLGAVTISNNSTRTLGAASKMTSLSIGSGSTFALAGNNFDFSSSAPVSNSGNLKLRGSETLTNVSNLDIDSGTVEYVGDGDSAADTYTIKDFGNGTDYYNLTINSTDGSTDLFRLGANVDINGNFNNAAGSFDVSASNYSMSVAGSWTNNGSFNARAGTVNLDGASQNLFGSTSFFNLTKNVTNAASLTFQAGTTTSVTGTLDLRGAADQLLTLRSSSLGSAWSINPDGLRTVSFLSVRDSHNTNLTAVSCLTGCQDGTGNTGWLFTNPASSSTERTVLPATSLRNILFPLRTSNRSNLSSQNLGGLFNFRSASYASPVSGAGSLNRSNPFVFSNSFSSPPSFTNNSPEPME